MVTCGPFLAFGSLYQHPPDIIEKRLERSCTVQELANAFTTVQLDIQERDPILFHEMLSPHKTAAREADAIMEVKEWNEGSAFEKFMLDLAIHGTVKEQGDQFHSLCHAWAHAFEESTSAGEKDFVCMEDNNPLSKTKCRLDSRPDLADVSARQFRCGICGYEVCQACKEALEHMRGPSGWIDKSLAESFTEEDVRLQMLSEAELLQELDFAEQDAANLEALVAEVEEERGVQCQALPPVGDTRMHTNGETTPPDS